MITNISFNQAILDSLANRITDLYAEEGVTYDGLEIGWVSNYGGDLYRVHWTAETPEGKKRQSTDFLRFGVHDDQVFDIRFDE